NQNYKGDKNTDDWKSFEIYFKRVWFRIGNHHHFSSDRIKPDFSLEFLKQLLADNGTILEGEAFEVIFNDKDTKKVNLSPKADNAKQSAVNFYGPNITNKDVQTFYAKMKSPNPEKPLSFGLNSQLVKENG